MASKDLDKPAEAIELLTGARELAPEDSTAITRSIMERALRADTVEDIFAEEGTIATKDYVGIPIQVNGVKLNEGELEGEPSVYMLVEALNLNTGEVVILNTGAPNIMAKLYRLHQLEKLPIKVAVKEAAPGRRGQNAVLSLEYLGA